MSIKLRFYVFLIIITCSYAGSNESIFTSIQSNLERYRQSIAKEDIKIENGVIYLELVGRRTNHKSLLLLGYHSVGRSLQKHNISLRQVKIMIRYEMKDIQQIVATATIESVLSLSRGQMNPDQFFSEVRY